jgi:hypothetical protein
MCLRSALASHPLSEYNIFIDTRTARPDDPVPGTKLSAGKFDHRPYRDGRTECRVLPDEMSEVDRTLFNVFTFR